MKVDKSKIIHLWYEDEQGNKITIDTTTGKPSKPFEKVKKYTYHSTFPCTLSEEISRFNPFPVGDEPRFKHMMTGCSTWNDTCVLAMVKSGDYTLSEAIYVYARACERCINVLWNKYVGGEEGYPEDSKEYKECGTVCEFCNDDRI